MAAAIILALTLCMSLVGLWLAPRIIEWNLFRPYWFLPRRQYWTAIGSAFVHASLSHLLFNCLTFWFFALPLERVIGSARFALLYLLGLAAYLTAIALVQSRLNAVWRQSGAVSDAVDALDTAELPALG